jgi:acyl-CoA thioester hydrolase
MPKSSRLFTHTFRVTWENTDSAGYIHNSVVFRYFEIGELEALRSVDAHWSVFPDCGFPRIHVEADFQTPLHFDDLCVLETWVESVRYAGYVLGHRIRRGQDTAVTGSVTVCCISAETGRARPMPERLRNVLLELTGPGNAPAGTS